MAIQRKLKRLIDLVELKHFFLVDIGASGGIDPKWKVLGNRLFIVGFEPNEEEYKKLCNVKNARYFNIALADKHCQLKFYVLKKKDTSSFYKPNFDFLNRFPMVERFNKEKIVSIDADSLDNVLSSEGSKKIDFIKIDTQGYELNILSGAEKTLQKVFGVEIEVEFSVLYEGQPLFADVDSYLRSLGFTLFDLRPCYWKRTQNPFIKSVGQIIFADALYLKDYIAMGSTALEIAAPIIASVIYKKYDYALELLDYFYSTKQIEQAKKEKLDKLINKLAKQIINIPNFRGKTRIASYLGKLSDLLKSTSWARWDDWK